MATGRIFPTPVREEPDEARKRERKGRGSMRAAAPAMGWGRTKLLRQGSSGGRVNGAGWLAGGGYKTGTGGIGFFRRGGLGGGEEEKHKTTENPPPPPGGGGVAHTT